MKYGFKPRPNDGLDELDGEPLATVAPTPQVTPPPPSNPVYGNDDLLSRIGEDVIFKPETVYSQGPPGGTGNQKPDIPTDGMTFGDGGSAQDPPPGDTPTGDTPSAPAQKPTAFTPYTPPADTGPAASASYFQRGGGLDTDMSNYVRDWLAAPSAYDSDVVKGVMDSIAARMDKVRADGFQANQEYLAATGILGGTRAGEMQDLSRQGYDMQEQQLLAELGMEQARMFDAGRSNAWNAALGLSGLGENRFQFDEDMGFRRDSLSESSRQFGARLDMDRFLAEEAAARWAREFGLREDELAEGRRRFDEGAAFDRERFEYGKTQDDRRYDLDLLRTLGIDGLDASMLEALGLGEYAALLGNQGSSDTGPTYDYYGDPEYLGNDDDDRRRRDDPTREW